ncbi:chemotaxis protein CheW [Komagataeibacter melaceti]|uniref:Chemotaxis protein CheW n=1 Tax=Komagataeibacter melaceti TaxID=2766577 RepID=A0A371Z501_9PROT|nr:chemotaxis protein CheW [Komagataeibacter melaceti]RFD21573.1 chemotaxis protein CheW [Komagataeibacter melaceti]
MLAFNMLHGDQQQALQVLTFMVNGESYALPILYVMEIRIWTGGSPLPSAPAYLKGVMNLRGAMIPVIDMHVIFATEKKHKTEDESGNVPAAVIIVELGGEPAGLLVDKVQDIVTLTADDIKQIPTAAGQETHKILSGLITIKDRIIGHLDLDAFSKWIELPNLNGSESAPVKVTNG